MISASLSDRVPSLLAAGTHGVLAMFVASCGMSFGLSALQPEMDLVPVGARLLVVFVPMWGMLTASMVGLWRRQAWGYQLALVVDVLLALLITLGQLGAVTGLPAWLVLVALSLVVVSGARDAEPARALAAW